MISRALAVAGLLVAVAAAALVLLGDEPRTRYEVRLQNAGQLVKDNDVQIGGRRVGRVTDIRLADDAMAELEIEVEEGYAPLHQGTTAVVRATSLSGVANRYVALSPGPDSAPELRDGATIEADDTTAIVDLDQLFNTLDRDTREDLGETIRGLGTWYAGRGEEANEAARYFNPALSASRRLVSEAVRDEQALRDFLRSSAKTVGALSDRRDDLSALIANANRTAGAIGDERAALDAALERLPATLRKSNTTFVNLRSTLDDLDVLVAESKPATKDLERFLRELRPVIADARPTIGDLRTLIRRDGDGNDLTDLLRKAPALERAAKPAIANSIDALRGTTPVLAFARPYMPDLAGWFRGFGQSASNYDANGHFARIQPIFNAFQLQDNPTGQVLVPRDPSRRLEGLQVGQLRRCPGAATAPLRDGSNVWRDVDGTLDCDPAAVPPGP